MKVSYFIGYPDTSKSGLIDPALHFSPNYLSLHLGTDGITKPFYGKMKHITWRVGLGAYVDSSSRKAEE